LLARIRWLRTELSRSGLPGRRRDLLDRQLVALQCAVRRAAGAPIGYRAEVQAYFDTEIAPGEPDRYRAAHADLAEALAASTCRRDPLAVRLRRYRAATRLPPGLLGPSAERLTQVLREAARRAFGLPAGEAVYLETVVDRPWSALHRYLGEYRSRVWVGRDVEMSALQLARLVAHETYPGHHLEHVGAERACSGGEDVQDGLENSLFLMNTPQCLLSEGLAELALDVLAGPSVADWLPAALDGLGPVPRAEDAELAVRVERALEPLAGVRQDVALLLHDRGGSEEAAIKYLCRWLLVDEPRARRMLRFITHPRWRAYPTTYAEGRPLARAWLAAAPEGQPVTQRYLELRTSPRSPSGLRAELPGYRGAGPAA
jgi:hypothetical protein